MAKKKSKLSLDPQQIDKENWYYEEKKGVLLVHEIRTKDGYLRTDQILIPWRMIAASMKRKEG